MNPSLSNGLPQRLGGSQHEALLKHAAPSTFFHVHPGNTDKIPCFISGYKVCLLAGQEGAGMVFLRPEREYLNLQLTDAASGVSSTRPCFVPIDGMHRAVAADAYGCAAPHLIRVRIMGVIDEYGVVQGRGFGNEGFPQTGQDAFLFPQGIRHSVTERENCEPPESGLKISGLFGGRTATLAPLRHSSHDHRGIPVLCPRTGDLVATMWG